MTGLRQVRLVARRELLERSRSKGFRAGTVLMLVFVVAVIVLPELVEGGRVTRDVGFSGTTPDALAATVVDQGDAADVTVRIHRYADRVTGEEAVRDEDVDVLVVDARRLQWRGDTDDELRAIVTQAIQLVAVQARAAAAGIGSEELLALVTPVEVEDEQLGVTEGRSSDDEMAAYITSVLLMIALASYGQLVLTGVVQEKSSRVVEVLLARMPPRNLLAGKVAGIGLLGFGQFAVTAVAALVATIAVDADLPAVSGEVLAWVVVWFVLGYALYATAYGTLGSLASRTEDASSVAAPATTALVVGYWASLMAVGGHPEGVWSRVVSLVPFTAPFAMPGRLALGAAEWWEAPAAVALTVAAIAGLVVLGGPVYAGAILRAGATVKLRDAWRGMPAVPSGQRPPRARPALDRSTNALLAGIAAVVGLAVYVLTRDVVIGIAVGAGCYGVVSRIVKARDATN